MNKTFKYLKEYKKHAIISSLIMIVVVFLEILIPTIMKNIVDIGIENNSVNYVVKYGLLMIFLSILAMGLNIIVTTLSAIAGNGLAANLREESYKKIQKFSFANIDDFSVPSLITRLTNDAEMVGMVVTMGTSIATKAPMLMIFALIMSFRLNKELAKIFLFVLPILLIASLIILALARPFFKRMQKKLDGLNSVIRENLAGIGVVKSFNRQSYEKDKFDERNDDYKNTILKALKIVFLYGPILNLAIYSTIILVLWFGGNQISLGLMSKGTLITFITYIMQILMGFMMISMFFMQFLSGQASADRIMEVIETESDIKEEKHHLEHIQDGSIEFSNVSFYYPKSNDASLSDIDLTIKSGEKVGIIGSTGSSKSTLVQLIPRLYDVTSGEVLVGGKNVKDYSLKALRDQISYVLQANTLFSGTIRSNIQWGKEDASDEEIIDVLKKSQAWEFVGNYDDPLEKEVEQGGRNFSGGQKQRLTIARSLIKRPKILILDDSTSAVDMSTDRKIQDMLKREFPETTVLMITQRISSIENFDKIIVMEKGRIDSIGSHQELLETSEIYKDVYRSQVGEVADEQ